MLENKNADKPLLQLQMRKKQSQHRFGSNQRRRQILLGLILAWPVVVVLGWGLNRASGSSAPLSALPVLWLMIVAFVIEQTHLES